LQETKPRKAEGKIGGILGQRAGAINRGNIGMKGMRQRGRKGVVQRHSLVEVTLKSLVVKKKTIKGLKPTGKRPLGPFTF